MLDLSIIIPIYNEEVRLVRSLNILNKYLHQNINGKLEIIFVSDGSTDKSNLIIEKFKSEKKRKFNIKFFKYKKNIGKGYAVRKGVLNASNFLILICDIDFSVHPRQFNNWYNKKLLKSQNKAYYGSREHGLSKVKASKFRVFLGFFFKKLIKYLFKIKLTDTQCGFKVFNKNYSKKIFKQIKSYRFAFDVELTIILNKSGINIVELPLEWVHKSGSKLSFFKDIPRMILDIILIKIRKI